MNNYSQAMLEQCKVEQSLFSIDNDYKHSMFECPFEYENVERELDNRFNEGIYGYLEKKILQALYVFHFLNRKNIERYFPNYQEISFFFRVNFSNKLSEQYIFHLSYNKRRDWSIPF